MPSLVNHIRPGAPLRAVSLRAFTPRKPELDLDALRRASWDAGRREAEAEARKQLEEQAAEFERRYDALLQELSQAHAKLAAKLAEALPGLAIEVTRRVLGGFEPNADQVQAIVEEILSDLPSGTTGIELNLAPGDLDRVGALPARIADRYPGIRLEADPALAPGDCIMRSQFGLVDARVEVKLQNLALSMR